MDGGQIETLELNYAHGFSEHNLEFLQPWPLRRLQVLARTIRDPSPIYHLAGSLEELSLTISARATLDLTRLPRLQSIWTESWKNVRDTISQAEQLKRFGVYGYTDEDLIALANNAELRTVRLKGASRLSNLVGVARLPLLEELEIARAPRLSDLTSLEGHVPRLRRLHFETCGGLSSLAALSERRGLEDLSVANCGPLETLAPLRGMTSLTRLYLYESTRITDGDLTPVLSLRGLKDFRMQSRAHYVPKVAEVKALLGI